MNIWENLDFKKMRKENGKDLDLIKSADALRSSEGYCNKNYPGLALTSKDYNYYRKLALCKYNIESTEDLNYF